MIANQKELSSMSSPGGVCNVIFSTWPSKQASQTLPALSPRRDTAVQPAALAGCYLTPRGRHTTASSRGGLRAASPRGGLTLVPPRDGLREVSPRGGLVAASPRSTLSPRHSVLYPWCFGAPKPRDSAMGVELQDTRTRSGGLALEPGPDVSVGSDRFDSLPPELAARVLVAGTLSAIDLVSAILASRALARPSQVRYRPLARTPAHPHRHASGAAAQ